MPIFIRRHNNYIPERLQALAKVIYALLLVSSACGQTIYLPVNHWAYEFLERLEVQRILPIVLSGTKPLTRMDVAGYLAPLYASDSLQQKLSRVQRQQLSWLAVELQEELAQTTPIKTNLQRLVRNKWIDPWLPDFIYANGRNFYSLASSPFRINVDPILKRQRSWATADSLAKTEKVFENGNGLRLWGSVGQVGFSIDVRDHQEWGTRKYPGIVNYTKERLGFVRGNSHGLDHDETNAYLLYQHRYFTIGFGKDVNRWGPGYAGQLALSDYATSYDQLKFSVGNQRIRFTSVTAILQHYTDKFFYDGHEEKYLAGHRLEIAPSRWLNLGLHETIIYGGRKFEAAYLNPVMFYRSAEHYLGDRDNAALGLDCEILGLPKTKFYAELFIDDISTAKLGSGFYGNKYAYTLGAVHVNALGLSDLDLAIEFTRIRPFTYDHSGTTGYYHYSTLLGHWLGPNSESLFVQALYRVSQPLLFKVSGRIIRHGANPANVNVGGDYRIVRDPARDPENVNLLDGLLQSSRQLTLFGSWEFLRNYYLQMEWQWGKYDHERTSGKLTGNFTQFTFWLCINY